MHSASDFDAMVLLPVKPYMHTRYGVLEGDVFFEHSETPLTKIRV